MPTFNIKVKWGKENYKLDVNTDEDVMLFKVKHFLSASHVFFYNF